MAQIQITLTIVKDYTSLHHYSKKEEPDEVDMDQGAQKPWGMIFTWARSRTSSQRLLCLGLDICGVRRWEQMLLRTPEIAVRAFTRSEMQWTAAQPERLARLWTIKEAFVKALGCGFVGLSYHDIAIEFVPDGLTIQLPTTAPFDIPGISGEQGILDVNWQLILFGEQDLPGTLILAWTVNEQRAVDCIPETLLCHATEIHKIVLDLRPVTGLQQGTRREKRTADSPMAKKPSRACVGGMVQADRVVSLAEGVVCRNAPHPRTSSAVIWQSNER